MALISPLETSINSIKFSYLTPSIGLFVKYARIFNLSAPAAVKFENPCALSLRSGAMSELMVSSKTSKPTLYDGNLLYGSRIIVCSGISMKYPLTK